MTLDLGNLAGLVDLPTVAEGVASDATADTANFLERLFLGNVPNTVSRTRHGLVLRIDGRIVGAATSISWQQSQGLEETFELGRYDGLPNHLVPATVGSRTISLGRIDLYSDLFEELTASQGGQRRGRRSNERLRQELLHLGQSRSPFTLDEVWDGPELVPSRGYRYYCRWQSLNREASAEGDAVIRCSGTAVWYRRESITGRV